MYVEYSEKNSFQLRCHSYGNKVNPSRNYELFSILSRGVRGDNTRGFITRGLPKVLGYVSEHDNKIFVTDTPNPNDYTYSVTSNKAKEWNQRLGCVLDERDGEIVYVSDPDFHSHSWLTTQELAKAFSIYKHKTKYSVGTEYKALLASMRAIEKDGFDARVVFWFDN